MIESSQEPIENEIDQTPGIEELSEDDLEDVAGGWSQDNDGDGG
ncbi:MAG: hypothetical protein AAF725_09850 [Acidobacteriota bacterium]